MIVESQRPCPLTNLLLSTEHLKTKEGFEPDVHEKGGNTALRKKVVRRRLPGHHLPGGRGGGVGAGWVGPIHFHPLWCPC